MLLGGVLKLLGRRDRRTLRLFRLVVLGLGRLLVAFFVLLAFIAFGLVLGVLVSLVRLRGLDRLTLFTLFRVAVCGGLLGLRSEEHTSELQSLMRISYADFCLKKKNILILNYTITNDI